MTTVRVPTLPTRLSARYEAGPVLGRGVGSVVLRAHDTLLGRDAAVKVFRVDADARADRELSLLARFDHPGLVPVFDVEEHDGRAFVVMALLDGGSLASRLAGADDGLGLAVALRTAATVGGALDHLHRAGVTHRGVTPANVLFDGDGRAHLADFGVALVADAPRITDTGLTVGAAPYLAPEQVRGEAAGAAADVYALGLVLLEALTGRRAFPGDPLSAAHARLDRAPTLPDDLPADVAALLVAMTAPDPADRPDAAAASGTLRRALVEAEPPTAALVATPGVRATGPATTTGLGGLTVVGAPGRRAPAPRATGTRGVVVLAGLAASAVLAGTVAIASSGPVAEVSAADRPAVVVGGATVGAPDTAAPDVPAFVVPDPASAAPTAPTEASVTPAPVAADPDPVRQVADPAPETTTARPEPSRTTDDGDRPTRSSATTRESDTADRSEAEPAAGADRDGDADRSGGGEQATQQEPTAKRGGAVGEVVRGVGGLLGGAVGGSSR